MATGKRFETSYAGLDRIVSLPYFRENSAQAIYAATREVVVTIRLADGSLVEGFRIPKQQIMPIEFLGLTESKPGLNKVELWALSTPEKVRTAQYV